MLVPCAVRSKLYRRLLIAVTGAVAASLLLVLLAAGCGRELLGVTSAGGERHAWLRAPGARAASRYLRLGRTTALLPPPMQLCAGLPPPSLLLAVPSGIGNRRSRDAVRATWGRALSQHTRLLFVLGHAGDSQLQPGLLSEALEHGDILVEDVVDNYDNLTLKTLFSLKWAVDNCPNVSYVLKVDDDVLLNLRGMARVLSEAAAAGWPLVGDVQAAAPVIRSPGNKWSMPRWLFAGDTYPAFVSGPSYAVAGSALRPLLRAALHTPLLPLEDVYTAGAVAQAAGLRHGHVAGVAAHPVLAPLRPCAARAKLSMHGLSPDEIHSLWQSVRSPPTGLTWLLANLGFCNAMHPW